MSESPVEHFEHAEHAEHASLLGDPFLTQVSVTIAILAVVAATVGSLETLETAGAIGDKNAAVLLQNKATDTWNFYQAKSIKKIFTPSRRRTAGRRPATSKNRRRGTVRTSRIFPPRVRRLNINPRKSWGTANVMKTAIIF